MFKLMTVLGTVASLAVMSVYAADESADTIVAPTTATPSADAPAELQIPCPQGWSVENNPSVENSLSYLHEGGDLAVNITYVAATVGANVEPEAYARVAAEQLSCNMPVRSNLIENAWSFTCDPQGVEAIVYGQQGNLVLLSISGRSTETESYLEDFVRFLAYQARRN